MPRLQTRGTGVVFLTDDNHSFKKDRSRGQTTYYVCTNNDCTSRLHTTLGSIVIIKQPSAHNHPPDLQKLRRANFKQQFALKIAEEPANRLTDVYNNIADNKFPDDGEKLTANSFSKKRIEKMDLLFFLQTLI